jgi:dipeptidyl aminopeptidase/acylaminoacyl peptidase
VFGAGRNPTRSARTERGVPDAPGPFPIIVHNHGGVGGIGVGNWGPVPGNLCHSTASTGAILAQPQNRGVSDTGNNSVLGPVDIRSQGTVEFCSGEVDDALALMRIAQARCDALPDRVAMWGESHGACISLIAASRHPEGLRAVAGLVPPIDLVEGYRYNLARSPGGSVEPEPGCDPVNDHLYISAGFSSLFGTPESNPTGYAARSAIHQAEALAQIPTMLIFGMADCLIPVPSQACAVRDALVAQGATVEALRHSFASAPAGLISAGAGAGPVFRARRRDPPLVRLPRRGVPRRRWR